MFMRITAITSLFLAATCLLGAAETKETAEDKSEAKPAEAPAADSAAPAESTATAEVDPVLLMPEYQVSSSRISELDIQIKKLDKTIARAKKKLKPSELDETLNGDDTPKAMLIFGGKTASQRKSVAAERVNLMETERDILEAMKHVRTKKEEEDLKTQLNALKTMRRELDETLR
jgi:hypothetical protein|uniref:hypothetical protein n=1 Tax=Cephaloticoccus sp. TaxID=1985742 RepID=UPI00404A63BB